MADHSNNNNNTTFATNNGTSVVICARPEWFWRLSGRLDFACNHALLPIYVAVALIGHPFFLYAVFKQASQAKGYMFQAYLSISELSDVLSHMVQFHLLEWSGIDGRSKSWFTSSHWAMFVATSFGLPLSMTTRTLAILMAVCMAADRVYALAKPIAYYSNAMNMAKKQRIVLACCVMVAAVSSAHAAFIFKLERADGDPSNNGGYKAVANLYYLTSIWSPILGLTLCALRALSTLLLIAFNVVIVRLYRKRLKKGKTLFQRSTTTKQKSPGDIEKEAMEKSLSRLTVTQSLFTTVTVSVQVAFWTTVYTLPSFNLCEAKIFAPLMNILCMTCSIFDLCCDILINPKTRNALVVGAQRVRDYFKG